MNRFLWKSCLPGLAGLALLGSMFTAGAATGDAGAGAAATTTATTAPAQQAKRSSRRPPARLEDFTGHYALLAEKNIFIKNRPPTRVAVVEVPVVVPARPEATLVLTGIAIQEGRHVAFLENTATHATQRLVPGDAIAGLPNGKVLAVTFDAFEFESGGKPVQIALGRNLLGDVYTPPAPPPAAPPPPPRPPAAPSPPPGAVAPQGAPQAIYPAPPPPENVNQPVPVDPQTDVEHRMRLRREQETKG